MSQPRMAFVLSLLLFFALWLNGAAAPSESHHLTYFPYTPHQEPYRDVELLISAVYYNTYLRFEPEEAFRLYNAGAARLSLQDWQVSDGRRTVTFPLVHLDPDEHLWCTREAVAFHSEFGFEPDCEYAADTDPVVPNLTGTALRFANAGGEVLLIRPDGQVSDYVAYANATPRPEYWQGPPAHAYNPSPTFPIQGQILHRKRGADGRPVSDTDTAADWARHLDDLEWGRRVQYAGWRLEEYWQTATITATAAITIAVAPDHLYEVLDSTIQRAQHKLYFWGYTLAHEELAQAMAARAAAGVEVQVLLEGGPSGGISPLQQWSTQQIVAAGGQVWYMVNDRQDANARYRNLHAKVFLIDDRLALIGTDNLSPRSMPTGDKSRGTLGHRGYYLITDAPGAVEYLSQVFAEDLAPGVYRDIYPWTEDDEKYGAPPPDYTPEGGINGDVYALIAPEPFATSGAFAFEIVQSPENSVRPNSGLLGLLQRAGPGDLILVQQLMEHSFWGPTSGNPDSDPNLRVRAYLEAAHRGATVRVMLDRFYDSPANLRSNFATVNYLNDVAAAENLDLKARRVNPTGHGVHAKLVLAQIGGRGYVHLGSLNGSEASHKVNREIAVQLASDAAFAYLRDIFAHDWDSGQ